MNEIAQYYRAEKQYLVRLYCDCRAEIVNSKCIKCHKVFVTARDYPYWRVKKPNA